eukprot:TRINITY_DN4820_c0_g1_i2.p1 TRINITY_DN4820_c0_g1~~TRINITY_DN4820_c0_g1_i2.p1  ORF type:complete len:315 (-),score=37.43 TRINITY_DN4820_c0_g1_i2:597-1541(-)
MIRNTKALWLRYTRSCRRRVLYRQVQSDAEILKTIEKEAQLDLGSVTEKRNNVAIVGAGLSGLTSALSLKPVFNSVTVYEQEPSINQAGDYMIHLRGDLGAVGLSKLNLWEKVKKASQTRKEGIYYDKNGEQLMRFIPHMVETPAKLSDRRIKYNTLRDILIERCNELSIQINWDRKLADLSLEKSEDDLRPKLTFQNHNHENFQVDEADICLLATGFYSPLRQTIFPKDSKRDTIDVIRVVGTTHSEASLLEKYNTLLNNVDEIALLSNSATDQGVTFQVRAQDETWNSVIWSVSFPTRNKYPPPAPLIVSLI